MKTIFDKVDPKYIECTTGVCEHAAHSTNMYMWIVVAILALTIKYLYGHQSKRDSTRN